MKYLISILGLIIGWIISLFKAYFAGEEHSKYKNLEEELDDVRDSRKINNNVANLSDIELNHKLQKWNRKK